MLEEVRRSDCPVIWAHDSIDVPTSTANDGLAAQQLGRVLGQAITPDWTCSALPIVVADSDGVVRQYSESYPIRNEAAGTHADRFEPTLPVALHAAWNRRPKQCVGQENRPTQEFRLERIRFHSPPWDLQAACSHGPSGSSERQSSGVFPDRRCKPARQGAVVLGAGYRHARDTHPTPVGALTGAEVVATAALTVADPIHEIKPRVELCPRCEHRHCPVLPGARDGTGDRYGLFSYRLSQPELWRRSRSPGCSSTTWDISWGFLPHSEAS